MSYNLMITFDLVRPGQNYRAVHDAIKSLGWWAHFQQSAFYVHSALNPDQASAYIRSVMDDNDKLAVASVHRIVLTWPKHLIDQINEVWFDRAA